MSAADTPSAPPAPAMAAMMNTISTSTWKLTRKYWMGRVASMPR